MSEELGIFFLLLIAGAAGGFVSGLLGVGGGIIFIPILDMMLTSLVPDSAELVKYLLANSLFILFFSGVVNVIRQIRIGNFYPKAVLTTAIAGIVTVFISTYLIRQGDWYSRKLFTTIFIIMLVPLIINMFRKAKTSDEAVNPNLIKLLPIGAGGGLVSAFAGLGGGVLMIPALTYFLKLPMKRAASISAGVIPFMTLPVILQYVFASPNHVLANSFGYVLPLKSFPMVLGAISFVGFGIKMGHKWPDRIIRNIFGFFILSVVLRNLYILFIQN